MVWNIVHDLNFTLAKEVPMEKRIPFLEFSALTNDLKQGIDELGKESIGNSISFATNLSKSEQRLIKTHLSYEMLPDQVREKRPKLIYVTRNPRDTVVSFYNHWKVLAGFTGSLTQKFRCSVPYLDVYR